MKTLKHALRVGVIALALLLVLTACGGSSNNDTSDDNALAGVYVFEDGTPGTWTFTGDTFVAAVPFDEMGLSDLDGDFTLRGTFEINEDTSTIYLTVDIDALSADTLQLTRDLIAQDPDLVDLMEDEAFAELMEQIIDATFDAIFDSIVHEFEDLTLTFEDNFDRLYTEEGDALVRQ